MLGAAEELSGEALWSTLLVSALRVELLVELVSIELLALSVPLWVDAEAPVPVVSVAVVSVAPMSPVSLRAHPAKQIKVAAINANFFIFQLLVALAIGPACFSESKSLARNHSPASDGFLNAVEVGLLSSSLFTAAPSADGSSPA